LAQTQFDLAGAQSFLETTMFSWLLNNPRVTEMACGIHDTCYYALHSRDTFGTPLHQFFSKHPLLRKHDEPTPSDRDQIHTFWLQDKRQSLEIMCFDDEDIDRSWLSVSPDGDFLGVSNQSSTKAQYLVRYDNPISRPEGRLSKMHLREFISKYESIDLTV